MLHNPEYRLKARSSQDRSVTQRNARTTDKGFPSGRIYSLVSHYNKMKCELRNRNALGFANREGADPDTMILSFQSYTALENALGAKVQYVDVKHEEANIAFEGIRFHSAYGYVTVLADRSCQPQTAWCLSLDSWKLRSLGKAPHILTYGLEGLEGLRVGNSDALEVRKQRRIDAHYKFSLIDLEARQGDRAQAFNYAA